MIEFYHRPRTRAVRLVWAAEELSIPYEIKSADFRHPSPEFLAVSPVGTLPGMKDGDLVLTNLSPSRNTSPTPMRAEN